MKKLSFLFAFALLALASCKKNEGSQQPMTYMVNGITDISMFGTDVAGMGLSIEYRGPVQENVALSITGLPENVTAEFSTASGIPTFGTSVAITSQNAVAGTYPLKLVCKGSATGEKSYDLTLTIKPVPCTQVVSGSYQTSNTCFPGSTNSFISHLGGNNIMINNLGGMGFSVNATIDCNSSTITIPSQTVGGSVTVAGSGSYVVSLGGTVSMSINYNYNVGAGPTPCTASMFK